MIDADALIALIKKRLKNEHIIGWLCGIIAEVPTIEARPVVRGRWVDLGRNYYTVVSQCSECGAKYDFRSTYCPNCGAEMRTKEEE